MVFNGRWIGTSKAVPDERSWQRGGEKLSSWCSLLTQWPRINFTLIRLTTVASTFAFKRFYDTILRSMMTHHKIKVGDFTPDKLAYIRRLMTGSIRNRQMTLRAFTVFHFIISNYITIRSSHALLSVIFHQYFGP